MARTGTERGADTRRRIIEAAAELLLQHGYSGTSMADILSATGLTKGGFYFHFQSKAHLALEVLDAVRAAHRDDIVARAGRHERAVDQLAELIRAAAAEKRAKPSMSALGRLCQELATEPLAAGQLRPFEGWIEITGQLLRLAQAQGDLASDADVDVLAPLAVAAYVGMDQLADLNGVDIGAEQAEDFVAFAFRAIGLVPPARDASHRHDDGADRRRGPGQRARNDDEGS